MAKGRKVYLLIHVEGAGDHKREIVQTVFGDFGRAVQAGSQLAAQLGGPVPFKKSWSNRRKADEIKRVTEQRASDANIEGLASVRIDVRAVL